MRRALPLVVLALAFAGGLRTVISGTDPAVQCRDDGSRRRTRSPRPARPTTAARRRRADPDHPRARSTALPRRDGPRAEAEPAGVGRPDRGAGHRRLPRGGDPDADADRDRDADGDRRPRRRPRPRRRTTRRRATPTEAPTEEPTPEPTETPAPTEPPVEPTATPEVPSGHGAALRGPLPAGAPARRGWHGHGPARVRHAAGALVAVKLLAEHLAEDSAFISRFRREALSAAKLVHPNIVQVFDFGTDNALRAPVHRHGVRRRPLVRRAAARPRADGAARRRRDPHPGLPRARLRAPQRRHPP